MFVNYVQSWKSNKENWVNSNICDFADDGHEVYHSGWKCQISMMRKL